MAALHPLGVEWDRVDLGRDVAITRDEAIAKYGPVLDGDEAIDIAGQHGHELSDLIDDGKLTMHQRTTDDVVQGSKTILTYCLADDLFAALA